MVKEQIVDIVATKLEMEAGEIPTDVSFKDMKIDSLYIVEIMLTIEETFNIIIDDAAELENIDQIAAYVESQL